MSKLYFDEECGTWYRVIYTSSYRSYSAQERNSRKKLRFANSAEERAALYEEMTRFTELRKNCIIRREVSPPTEQGKTTPEPPGQSS